MKKPSKRLHRIARFKGGYNYRGYCVYRLPRKWTEKDEDGNQIAFYKTLSAFKRMVDALIERRERAA